MSARDVIDDYILKWARVSNPLHADAIISALRANGYVIECDWQPIETAPRDGTQIIGTVHHPATKIDSEKWSMFICWWKEGAASLLSPGLSTKAGWMSDLCVDFGGHEYPTRWRPLPTPPKETPNEQ